MKIAIVGPIATCDVAPLLGDVANRAPLGYAGAPLLATLIGGLIERDHCVTGITTDVGINAGRERVDISGERLRMIYCPQRPRSFALQDGQLGRALDLFAVERRHLSATIQSIDVDVIHAHWLYEFAWAALDTGLPCLITAHDSPRQVLRFSPNIYRLMRYLMARLVAHRAPRLTAVSPYMAKELRRITRVDADVVPNPLPRLAEKFFLAHAKEEPLQRSAGLRLVMVMNGWGARKNGRRALEGFAKFRALFPDAALSIFGADCGPGELAYEEAARLRLTEGVSFRGQVPHHQLLESLVAHDVLLHPALEESFGMAVAEAMALGLPVIAGKDSGAVPWVVGDAGLLVDVRDPTDIAAAACELASKPDLRSELGRRSSDSARRRFSRDAVIATTESIYRDVVTSWRRR